ncbi:hypothetical protein [Peredibacter starrii]|uniref:Uncharacterized protein n=1 Tax=Peredibacter starrii TaxID=28202 RepID=A0AAX4HL92_9BACT|nr:hypothetical protein [Peredibacter starrii]WPU63923.1 hypothetical protein SOO65_14605 [Peredibacter starrii]
MKYCVLTLFLVLSSNVFASEYTFESTELPLTEKQSRMLDTLVPATVDPGQVISWGKDIVALGEAIYELVRKGRPTSQTEYAPISVVPRDPVTRNYVEPMELEDATDPIKRRFVVSAKNGWGSEVLRVEYLLLFQVAKYNGKGKYILNAVMIPSVKVGYGFDFTSKMKVAGVSNKGKASDPLVSMTLDVHHTVGSIVNELEGHTVVTLTGNGTVTLE